MGRLWITCRGSGSVGREYLSHARFPEFESRRAPFFLLLFFFRFPPVPYRSVVFILLLTTGLCRFLALGNFDAHNNANTRFTDTKLHFKWVSILMGYHSRCCSELWTGFLFSKYSLLCFLEHEARSSTIDKHVWDEDLCVQLSGHLQASQDISSGQKKESPW